MESESLLQTLDEIGKTGLYFVEPHHQRLKRIAEIIFMVNNIGRSPVFGKGWLYFFFPSRYSVIFGTISDLRLIFSAEK